MKKNIIITLLFLTQLTLQSQTSCDSKPWLNTSLSFDERVELLIDCLTLDEKVSQLLHASSEIERLDILVL